MAILFLIHEGFQLVQQHRFLRSAVDHQVLGPFGDHARVFWVQHGEEGLDCNRTAKIFIQRIYSLKNLIIHSIKIMLYRRPPPDQDNR